MYVVYVWTGGWLISLVLVTSDNKGLLLLLLLLPAATVGQKNRRQLCLNEIKRVDWTETARICSAHFSEKVQ